MKVRQTKEVCTAKFRDKLVIFNLKNYRSVILNNTAALVWNFCKTPRSLYQIYKFLNSKYEVGLSQVQKDIGRLIGQLERRELVVCR
jgi:hypothetical protein